MGGLNTITVNDIVLAQCKRALLGNSLGTSAYWVDGVVIDTGPNSLAKEYMSFFREKKISKVALTHSHEDHCGNAAFLVEKGIPVYLHQSSVSDVSKPARVPFYRWVFWRPRPPFKANPLPTELETAKGKKIKVIEAPGHAADHVAYFYPEAGALFTGDLFVSTSTKMGARGENYVEWMKTLAALLEYDFELVCCGHSGILHNGKQLLAKKLQNLQELQERVLSLRQKGLTVEQINRELFPGQMQRRLLSGGEWDSIHIVRSFVEHS